MLSCLFISIILSTFLCRCYCQDVVPRTNITNGKLEYASLYEFPTPVSAANLIQRSNGKILVTTQGAPALYEIDPTGHDVARLVTTFSEHENTFGIAEVEPDVFYVTAGNYTHAPTWKGTQNSNSIYRVNVTSNVTHISKVVDLPEAYTLDGSTTINAETGLIMVGDTQSGILYLINVFHQTYKCVFYSQLLNQTASSPSELDHVGINGISYAQGYLYYTDTSRHTFGRIAMQDTGLPVGGLEDLLSLPLPDDIEVDNDIAILTELQYGLIVVHLKKSRGGNVQKTPLTDLPGANAVKWGSAPGAHCDLYALYNRKIINGTGSGLVRLDARGTDLRDGCSIL
ncbi:MAG: hypothetical protein M1828_000784 [Chrysothrix sp. TS-e1954]|nr:MAG: hypothetical protein M1828_000784 [Chrysothrix sp. TS-e1954]